MAFLTVSPPDGVSSDDLQALAALMGVAATWLSLLIWALAVWSRRMTAGQRNPGSAVVRGAARLLPQAVRCRWAEEWAGELYDLRAEGARWHRRLGYVVTVLCWTVPVLAVQLRLRPRRVVD